MDTTTSDVTPASPVPAAGEAPPVFEVVLPEGLTLPELPELPEPGATTAPAVHTPPADAVPAPHDAAAPALESPPTPASPPMPPGVRKERDKAKRRGEEAERAKADYLREKTRADALAAQVEQPIFRPLRPERLQALKAKADAGTMGDAVEVLVTAMGEMLQGGEATRAARVREQAERETFEEYQQRIVTLETEFKEEHQDFQEVLDRGGIWRLLQQDTQGRYVHPQGAHWARIIYGAPNPVAKAYELALGAIAAAGGELPEVAESRPSAPAPTMPPTTSPAPPPSPTTPAPPSTVAEAERRGAQRVTERVVANAQRPQGTRGLPPAGGAPSTTSWDRAALTRLQNADFKAYRALCDRNAGLEAFHQGWTSTPAG